MTFFSIIKCAFCFRRSCPKRYQVGNRTYYSHLGFVRTECPKKLGKHSYLTMDEMKEKALKKELERKKANEQQEKGGQVKKIVLVDDNSQYANAMAEFIEKPEKQECIVFTNPAEALNHIENNHVDILLTDYQMPNMNGCELAKRVLKKKSDIRIVIMSGYDNSYIKKICNEYGIDEKVEIIGKGNYEIFTTL